MVSSALILIAWMALLFTACSDVDPTPRPSVAPPALKPLVRFSGVNGKDGMHVIQGDEDPLVIRYDPGVDPETFQARLNGKDVTYLFDPETAEGAESISLPLSPGRNLLEIEVNSRQVTANPKSVLLPQRHTWVIHYGPLPVGVGMEQRIYFTDPLLGITPAPAQPAQPRGPLRRGP